MAEKIYFYPIWLRLWHVINALMFLLLILTGFSMQYTTPDSPFIRFDLAVRLHDIAGITVSIGYLFFILSNAFSGNGKYYRMHWKEFRNDLGKQGHYYLFGIFKGEHHPFPVSRIRKFNPLQKVTYIFSMYIGMPILIMTGLFLFYPAVFDLIGIGSLIIADVTHVLIGIIMTIFMVVHVYFCTIGHTPLSNFKSMANGWHDIHE